MRIRIKSGSYDIVVNSRLYITSATSFLSTKRILGKTLYVKNQYKVILSRCIK